MLPFGGQGSNQAIEDGGALGYLLKSVESPAAIPTRLKLFDQVRRNRASRVQTLSKVRIGKEKEVEQELKRYADNADLGKWHTFASNSQTTIMTLSKQCLGRSQSESPMTLGTLDSFHTQHVPSDKL